MDLYQLVSVWLQKYNLFSSTSHGFDFKLMQGRLSFDAIVNPLFGSD